jgi:hypothetical protein
MFLRWKSRRRFRGSTTFCPHSGLTLEYQAHITRSVKESGEQRPRPVRLHSFGGYFRDCCVDNPIARAYWWDGVGEAQGALVEAIGAKATQRFREQLRLKVALPTEVEWGEYERFVLEDKQLRIQGTFSLLNLVWPFTAEELKKAWRFFVSRHHPDKPEILNKEKALADFLRVQEEHKAATSLLAGRGVVLVY